MSFGNQPVIELHPENLPKDQLQRVYRRELSDQYVELIYSGRGRAMFYICRKNISGAMQHHMVGDATAKCEVGELATQRSFPPTTREDRKSGPHRVMSIVSEYVLIAERT